MTTAQRLPDAPPEQSASPAARTGRRRAHTLRRQLAVALVTTALLAVATFGLLNFVAARDLLVAGTQSRLAAVGALRAASIEAGADRLVAEVAVAASDVRVANALEEFSSAFAELDDEQLTQSQLAELEAYYADRVVDPLNAAGLGPFEAVDLIPDRPASRWVQYQYTLRPEGQPAPADAGDGSTYSELNAGVTDDVIRFSDAKGGGDLLLIDESGTVIYSRDKRIDLGADLVDGPLSETALARTAVGRLPTAPRGATLLTDFEVAAGGVPSLYAVSALSTGTRVVGALALELPVESLNEIASAGDSWEEIGLADGDTYIVSAESLLQSEPRAWRDDPTGYLAELRSGDDADRAAADLIERVGSPVGIQVVDTAPVLAALDVGSYRGSSANYADDATYTAASSFTPADRQWVVVTEAPRSVVLAPLGRYLLRIVAVLALVLPLVVLLAAWLSRVLARPIGPTVEAAAAIANGDRSPDLDTSRHDEFGDLARRLTTMAATLGAHETQLTNEYERTRRLLLAVLPPELVDMEGRVVGTGAATDEVTAVAVTLVAAGENDPGAVGEALQQSAGLVIDLAEQAGLERIRIAADRYLFLAGAHRDGDGAEQAVDFTDAFRAALRGHTDVDLEVHMGLSTGPVSTGLLKEGSLTFGAWGEPVRRALALASLAQLDEVLVDATTARACGRSADRLEAAHDVIALDDEPMEILALGPSRSG